MTSRTDLLAPVVDYYGHTIRTHGPTAHGADWKSAESQELRFAQLLKLCHTLDDVSLIDYGCGYGALLAYLEACKGRVQYSGFDITPGMIQEARRLHPEARFVDRESDLPAADYTVASGIFNVRLNASDEEWHAYVLDVLDRLAAHSLKGFAFNMLTSYADADRQKPSLYYADPLFMFDHCKRRFSRAVALLHDYPLYEFTTLVRL